MGDIKRSLESITATEHKLTEMISRHVKKNGPASFQNSSYVVTEIEDKINNYEPNNITVFQNSKTKQTEKKISSQNS